jgi:hypothetical protein
MGAIIWLDVQEVNVRSLGDDYPSLSLQWERLRRDLAGNQARA